MDESDMYTGVQASFGNEKPDQEDKALIEQQKREATALKVNIDMIREVINDERDAIKDIRSYIQSGLNPEGKPKDPAALMDEYRARELYMGFLDRLENAMANRLGEDT